MKRWIYIKGKSYEVGKDSIPEERKADYYVMPDIEPYRSMIDGTLITSRSRHREHLREHNCVEVGNDSSLSHEPRPIKPPPGLKETLIENANRLLRERK